MDSNSPRLNILVEGDLDEIVIHRVFSHLQLEIGAVFGKRGKSHLLERLRNYNQAAIYIPWFTLVDLDLDAECGPLVLRKWLPDQASKMIFRIAVRSIEAWLMADRESLANFLQISPTKFPISPDKEEHPKTALVNLARKSRRRVIREDIVPQQGSSRQVGPGYLSRTSEFVSAYWRPDVASEHSDSLFRCMNELQRWKESQSG